eukprot:NODE_31_length_37178_cov_0.413576.p6 type:complete len:479 gc:universal NODE_31_length_37178_cov_0.413576:17222-18658(+)
MEKLRVSIYLFRNDLRLHDNYALSKACGSDYLLPIFVMDPQYHQGAKTWNYGFDRQTPLKKQFLFQSLTDLKNSLTKLKSDLHVIAGNTAGIVQQVADQLKKNYNVSVILQKEVTYEETENEKEIEAYCNKSGAEYSAIWGSTLVHLNQIENMPDIFTSFRKNVEKSWDICQMNNVDLKPLPKFEKTQFEIVDLACDHTISDKSAIPFRGGENEAITRLNDYFFKLKLLKSYKDTRNGLIGSDYSSKFSIYLSLGCLSPRFVYFKVLEAENTKEIDPKSSAYWLIFELLWRDYFKFIALKYEKKLFFQGGPFNRKISWSTDSIKFEMWKNGKTGIPFIDANMRELKETGYMSNRGRQNVASFLTKSLGLDWRLGAEWFESQLIDHDPCSNYGNWLYQSGLAFDPRGNRKFNVIKQSKDYDLEGKYIRYWLPELDNITDHFVHYPWKVQNYISPIIVEPEWEKHYKNKVTARKPFKITK